MQPSVWDGEEEQVMGTINTLLPTDTIWMASDFLPVDEDTEWHFKFSFLPLTPMPQLNFLSLPSLLDGLKFLLAIFLCNSKRKTNKHHYTHSNTLYNSWSSMISTVLSSPGSFLFRRSKSEARWMTPLEELFFRTSLFTRKIIIISNFTS